MYDYIEAIRDNPIIAAVNNRQTLEDALTHGIMTVFLLDTDIFSAKVCVDIAKEAGSRIFLHIDSIDGLASSSRALDYVQSSIGPAGIISARSALIKYAREQGVFCIQRFFMVDSASFDNAVRTALKLRPAMVELMPGIIPGVIRRFTQAAPTPVIAGGLVTARGEAISALSAGAIGVSTSCQSLWSD